jgi:hypothetical protein
MPDRHGPQRLLAAFYALFALAAGARAGVQLATQAGRAPLAYSLSALAAAVYLVGAVMLRRRGETARRIALAVCAFELLGVLVVGAASRLAPGAFPDATVWSDFGGGYGHVPVLLPLAGLWWLTQPARRYAAA